jgi:hypothetical protein
MASEVICAISSQPGMAGAKRASGSSAVKAARSALLAKYSL